ncbi:MAG: zf-TFIIB domain-containing protein [Methanomassiliicoccales archaeon]|nr:MAG: zf-TFIIB domain-containing protein [Methanomassiliicoccales archaeon]
MSDGKSCPVCEKPMTSKVVQDVEIDVCQDCNGVWLDGGELKRLSGLDAQAGRIMTCSNCNSVMQTKTVTNVEIDICPKCDGIWLDQGELEKIAGVDPKTGKLTEWGVVLNILNEGGHIKIKTDKKE